MILKPEAAKRLGWAASCFRPIFGRHLSYRFEISQPPQKKKFALLSASRVLASSLFHLFLAWRRVETDHRNRMPSAFGQLNPARMRSYVLRIPVCTRVLVALMVVFWIGGLWSGFAAWARLEPKLVFAGGGECLIGSWR